MRRKAACISVLFALAAFSMLLSGCAQVQTATSQLRCMIDANKWKLIGDISASGALDFLGELRDVGKSAQTYNHYLKSAKQFTRWLVRDRRALVDPLAHLSKLNFNNGAVSVPLTSNRKSLDMC